jgi:hypothetical protein
MRTTVNARLDRADLQVLSTSLRVAQEAALKDPRLTAGEVAELLRSAADLEDRIDVWLQMLDGGDPPRRTTATDQDRRMHEMSPDNPDNPEPVPSLGVPPGISERWLERKAQHEAALEAEVREIAKEKQEREERIAREKRVVELLEQILEKLSK